LEQLVRHIELEPLPPQDQSKPGSGQPHTVVVLCVNEKAHGPEAALLQMQTDQGSQVLQEAPIGSSRLQFLEMICIKQRYVELPNTRTDEIVPLVVFTPI
jgi:hypothetical protein